MIPNLRAVIMEDGHRKAVAELEALCFSQPWSATALKLLTEGDGLGVVVTDEADRVLGYGGMLLAPDEGQITNVAVHPDHRRLGVGRTVLQALIAEAKKRDRAMLSLEVRVSNLAAISLYERHGFEIAGRRKRFYRDPVEDALVMLLQFT